MSLAEQFFDLFLGFMTSHGTYTVEDARAGSAKREIKRTARTIPQPITVDLWERHLAGTRPLGICPIDEAAMCRWGAVDIDVYDLVHADLVKELSSRKIPALVCRTKSGGAHVYVFFSEPIPAPEVLPRLRELAGVLGYGDAEVFPKQERILVEKGDHGNWLNMPYFKGDETERFCIGQNGLGMTAAQFVKAARAASMTREALLSLTIQSSVGGFEVGPPCLETLVSRGFQEGTRNNGLFALGVLAKKMSPDAWEPLLERWNSDYMTPPLSNQEVGLVVRSLRKKDYQYKCSDQPIVSHCNLALCRTRPHGVGTGGVATILESATILQSDPPLFFVNLKTGGTVEVTSRDMLDSRAFQLAVLTQLRQVIPLYKGDDWLRSVQKVVENATILETSAEVGVGGRFRELLEQFCTDRYAAASRDEVLLGKPWLDESSGRVLFRMADLEKHLATARFQDYTRAQLATRIRELGGGDAQFDARGKNVRAWWVPASALQWQTSPHDSPRVEDSPI